MKKSIFAFIFTFMSVCCAFAQSADDYKKYEVFVGYTNGQVDKGFDSGSTINSFARDRSTFHGVTASGVYNVSRFIGIKADFSAAYNRGSIPFSFISGGTPVTGAYRTTGSVYNFLGGIQIKDNAAKGRFRPFAHMLAGVGYKTSSIKGACPTGVICSGLDRSATGLAGAIGGGLDIKINKKLDFRAFQVDYNPMRLDGRTDHNVRIGIGFVFK